MLDRPGPIPQATLDDLWDFGDPAGSEERFASAENDESDPVRRAEFATQRARTLGLQQRFDEAAAVLDGIEVDAPVVRVRIALERGRLANSSGRPLDSIPFFAEAAQIAEAEQLAGEAGLTFLAIDAHHMLAIADPDSAVRHTRAGLSLVAASNDRRTRRWGMALHNNLGWAHHEATRYDEALNEFEAAHRAAQDYGTAEQEYVGRWAIARCLRSLGRYAEALAMQERLAAENPDDEYVTEELEALRAAIAER